MGATEEHITELIGSHGDVVFHYTTLDRAVRHILPTGQLRMSPFSSMRDPREYQRWYPTQTGWVVYPVVMEEWRRGDPEQVDAPVNELKNRFKLLSLTMDDPRDATAYGRGFARSRLWEAYGDEGRGVCLVFDKAALVECVMPASPVRWQVRHLRRRGLQGRPLSRELFVDVEDVVERGIDETVDEIVAKYLPALFFTKLTDWHSEHEFRFVVATESSDAVYVDASPALRHLIMGYECAPHFFLSLKGLARENRFRVRPPLSGSTRRRTSLATPQTEAVAKLTLGVDNHAQHTAIASPR